MDEYDYKGRVAAGVAWLDENWPGWRNRLETAGLDLEHPRNCVLARLGDDHYHVVLTRQGLTYERGGELGFSLYDAPRASYAQLTRTWLAALEPAAPVPHHERLFESDTLDFAYDEEFFQGAAARFAREFNVYVRVVSESGGGAGWPLVTFTGTFEDVVKCIKTAYESGDDGQDEYTLQLALAGGRYLD